MLDPTEFGKAMAYIVRDAQAPLLKRIEELEARQLQKGEPGKDGTSVTVDDVAPMIAEAIGRAVEAIPKPKDGEPGKDGDPGKDGRSVTVSDVVPLIDEKVRAAVAALPPPRPGDPGEPGKDAEPIDVSEIVRELASSTEVKTVLDLLVAESTLMYFAEHPVKDGKDAEAISPEQIAVAVKGYLTLNPVRDGKDASPVTDEQIHTAVAKYVSAHPPKDGDDGVGLASAMIDRDGNLVLTTTKGATVNLGKVVGSNGNDGADLSDASLDYDCERGLIIRGKGAEIVKRLPIPMDKGYWREGMSCEKADIVTHNGNAWIALRDTKSKPTVEAKEDWRLFARKGRDGMDSKIVRDAGPVPPVKLDNVHA